MDLIAKSINVIKNNQSPNGAYVACPTFGTYNYCWLRDGCFIAYAMDLCGEHESSLKFFDWVNNAILGIKDEINNLLQSIDKGEYLDAGQYPPARFNLDGSIDKSDWPNFQIDGYGIWLWALSMHLKMTNRTVLPEEYKESVDIVARYIIKCWGHECYDCWEEYGDKSHPSTLGCLYGGLNEINKYLPYSVDTTVHAIGLFIRDHYVQNDSLVKFIGSDDIDANLLWLCVPFNVFNPSSSVMKATVKRLESELLHAGGVHRYKKDTYYGGGEWLILSAWLGWYYAQTGDFHNAKLQRKWIEEYADKDGLMPEQTLEHVNDASMIDQWKALWGEPANPLLWSHAMYLVLNNAIEAECDG